MKHASAVQTNAAADRRGSRSDTKAVLLATRQLSKQYPGVRALDSVDFELLAGEVHVLFGENGAGKSTLIAMLAGAIKPSGGDIVFNGQAVQLNAVHDARQLGISAVFQEFSLIPQMTVEENIFLGAERTAGGLLAKSAQRRLARKIIDELGFRLQPEQRVDRLTRAEQQMVEIAKALRADVSVLILDEPTASLTHYETQQLFALIERLKNRGVGIVYITHRMAELRQIGDRITILRDGRKIDVVAAKTSSDDQLVRLMTGRVIGQIFPDIDFRPAQTVIKTDGLCSRDRTVRDVNIEVRRGEVVGLAGLLGSGKSEFAQCCFGAREIAGGSVTLKSEDVTGLSSAMLIKRGFLYLPADRHGEGLMMMRSVRENMSLLALANKPISNGLFIDRKAERLMIQALADRMNLSPNRVERRVEQFSGGNQQKAMLARCLTGDFDLIVFDEPTVGVDVGTRAAIYQFIAQLCESGVAIVLVSSDLPEILHLCHRAYVFCQGRVQAQLPREQLSEANVLAHFFEKESA